MKGKAILIVASALLLVAAVFIEKHFTLTTWQLLAVYLVPYLLVGHDTLKEAVEGLVHGDAFNEHFLMSIATIGALLIGFLPGAETQFPEAVFVMLFFQIGELFEGYAEGRSRQSIAHLMDMTFGLTWPIWLTATMSVPNKWRWERPSSYAPAKKCLSTASS